mmetsp:Transcript_11596/g.17620  ORF Transcript_11596/g.17620 Transcript_11596/m.17620 type:complete len:328 (-) Transcript_11596:118-1101(-)
MAARLAKTDGNIFIEKVEKFEDMIDIDESGSRNNTPGKSGRGSRRGPRNGRSGLAVTESSAEFKKIKTRERLQQEHMRTAVETKKNVEKSMKRAVDKKQRRFMHLTNDIEQCQQFLDTVDKSLSLHDEGARNKTRRQFEDWNANVHGKIQSDISQKLDGMEYKELNQRRNKDYQKFLDITNKKAAIFRDIIIESEYDPLEPNRRAVKAEPGKLKDPTLHILQKTIDEAAMLDPESGKTRRVRTGKDTLPVEMWASGKIEATPHGRFGKMMACAESSAKKNRAQRSNVVFDHYDFPVGKDAIDKEMPVGKRPCGTGANLGSNPIQHIE